MILNKTLYPLLSTASIKKHPNMTGSLFVDWDIKPQLNKQIQAFRFMMGPGHCPMISKYCPSLSKAVGRVDPSFLVVKKFHFNIKYSSYMESTNSTKQMSI